ncbi:putative ribonuclease H-like domain-containing protein [Tanacetum coccineum]
MVNTVKDKNVNTVRPKVVVNAVRPKAVVNAARPKAVVNVVKGNNVNAVKASACWVWKPKNKVLDHVFKTQQSNNHPEKIQRVKVIRCDNGTEFKNKEMNQFCERKCIKREFSVARTPQQNGVAERKNRTLIEAARTMLADSKLPTTFWAEAVNTACYVQNRVLVTKPHNKTPYELFLGRKPALGFMRPFGCHVTILNTIDHLGKFDCTKSCDDTGKARMESVPSKDYILLPLWTVNPLFSQISKSSPNAGFKPSSDNGNKVDEDSRNSEDIVYSYDDEDVGAAANMNNLDTFMPVSPISTTRVHKNHQVEQIIGDLNSARQTRRMTKNLEEHVEPKKIDVKSAFLYGKIEKEVYVCQSLGFEDPDFPNRVYKVEKALYGLHQALKAWYETLSTYLLDNGFQRGKIDKTLFIRKDKGDILLVQVYVDDIIFGSTKKSLCTEFEKMTHKKFQMSCMGELTFFLGLQVKKKEDGIFISQDKYMTEILKKFGFTDVKTASTHLWKLKRFCSRIKMATIKAKTVNGEVQLQALVDGKKIIITKSIERRDLLLEDAEATNQKFNFSKYIFESMVKNLENVFGKFLMYPRFVQVFLEKQLEGMSSHKRIYVTPSHTKKIFGNMRRVGKGFSGRETPLFQTMVVQHQEEMGEDNIADESINEEMDNSLERVATTATSLDVVVPGAKKPWGIQFLRLGLRMYLNIPMIHCSHENTKIAQAQEITSLKLRVKKFEKKGGSRTHKLKILYKGRKIDDINKDAEITLFDETQGRYGDDLMFDTGFLDDEEVFAGHDMDEKEINVAEKEISIVDPVTTVGEVVTTASPTETTTADDLTLAQTLIEIRNKGKGIMKEPEKPTKKKDQIRHDEEVAQRLQAQMKAELEEEDRLVRQREEEANIVSWDNVQEMIDDDYQMAQ